MFGPATTIYPLLKLYTVCNTKLIITTDTSQPITKNNPYIAYVFQSDKLLLEICTQVV